MKSNLLDMRGISKAFPGVQALDNVDFSLKHGEIHALIGENGAGKSTLANVLSGAFLPDAGTITIEGEEHVIPNPRTADLLGISMIHQEINLIPYLTVAQNIFLGREFTHAGFGIINNKKMNVEAAKHLKLLDISIPPDTLVGNLSVSEQQIIEITKAISKNTKLLILDEPTAALTIRETESLFQVLRNLKEKGVGMIYVSHRMEEIFNISDRITVLRDGKLVGSRNTVETNNNELVKMMVGREIINHYPQWKFSQEDKKVKLEVKNLNVKDKLKDISFELHSGEILGIAGLMGAGRSELAKSLFGVEKIESGTIRIDNMPVSIRSPKNAIDLGIALVVEDRKDEGLVLMSSLQNNIDLPNMDKITRFSVVKEKESTKLSRKAVDDLSVKTSSIKELTNALSGGNQQKVVIGKWLARNPQILILDEPTRGVDVGAKSEIYEIIIDLAKSGVAIIMISSDLPEVLNIPNRILVMHEGQITGEYLQKEATQEKIMLSATGASA